MTAGGTFAVLCDKARKVTSKEQANAFMEEARKALPGDENKSYRKRLHALVGGSLKEAERLEAIGNE